MKTFFSFRLKDREHFKNKKKVIVFHVYVFHLSGEIFELKAELNNEKKEKRKEAVKKVIAAMTVGKDVRYTSRLDFACYLGSFHSSIFHSSSTPLSLVG